jgi:hypothetical protein
MREREPPVALHVLMTIPERIISEALTGVGFVERRQRSEEDA